MNNVNNRIIICLWFCFTISLVPILALAAEKSLIASEGKIVSEGSNQIRCYQSPRYFVIEKNIKARVGNDFLVKFKATAEDNPPCSYALEDNDFEIKNEWAAYFSGLKDDLLFLESYTCPGPFILSIWDLTKRQKVFEGSCNDPIFQDDSILYWLDTGTAATRDNCPELPQWESHGLGGAIETRVQVSRYRGRFSIIFLA